MTFILATVDQDVANHITPIPEFKYIGTSADDEMC